MASKLECKKIGDTLTMHCMVCEVVESQIIDKKTGKPQEQVKFTDTRGDYLFLPRETADRQLSRCGFADGEMVLYGDVDGNTLVFSRPANKNPLFAPYWNIERVVSESAPRPSLTEAAKQEAERVRKAKNLPPDDDSMNIGKLPFDDVPPPDDKDSPYDPEDGLPKIKGGAAPNSQPAIDALQSKRQDIVEAYRFAYAASIDVQGPDSTAEAIQAGAATILIAMQKAGVA